MCTFSQLIMCWFFVARTIWLSLMDLLGCKIETNQGIWRSSLWCCGTCGSHNRVVFCGDGSIRLILKSILEFILDIGSKRLEIANSVMGLWDLLRGRKMMRDVMCGLVHLQDRWLNLSFDVAWDMMKCKGGVGWEIMWVRSYCSKWEGSARSF